MAATILVFDSGVGGLTVHAALRALLPDARYVYVADDAAFPYGRLTAEVCARRVVDVVEAAVDAFAPDIAVIACNTASTVALPALRAAHAVPFVGTVPAVKPAAALSRTKMISVLGTPGTVSREYTHDLIIQHAADCRVQLVGAPRLAELAEAHLKGDPPSDAEVLAEIEPCFREKDGLRTDAVALACTHYPLLTDVYTRIAPWRVQWIDPAPAIARRAKQLLAEGALPTGGETPTGGHRAMRGHSADAVFFTSGEPPGRALAVALAERGLRVQAGLAIRFP
jgi:glutamate racemase